MAHDHEALVKRLREFEAKATPEPWSVCTDRAGDTFVASMTDSAETVCEFGGGYDDEQQANLEADAALIVGLRNDAFPLIEQQAARIAELEEALMIIRNEGGQAEYRIARAALGDKQ